MFSMHCLFERKDIPHALGQIITKQAVTRPIISPVHIHENFPFVLSLMFYLQWNKTSSSGYSFMEKHNK